MWNARRIATSLMVLAGLVIGAAQDRADAQLRVDITRGNIQPMPIAIPVFVGTGGAWTSSATTSRRFSPPT